MLAAGAVALAVPLQTGVARAQTVPGCTGGDTPLADRLAASPVVFTGVVRALSEEGRLATVDVLQVWKGGPLAKRVDVRGTIAEQASIHTALDRIYAKDRTYLWAPLKGTSPHFVENQCSPTRSLNAEVNALAPKDLTAPGPDAGVDLPGASRTRLLPLALGGAAFVAIGALLVRTTRRPAQSP